MAENTLSVLKIAPGQHPQQVEIDNNLKALQEAVGGTIAAVYPFADPVAIICNDDGKLMGLPLNRSLRDENGQMYDAVAGDFLVVGLGEEDFANLFKGLRVDSGDNRAELQRIVEKFRSLGIDPRTKQVIFSNALDTDRAIEIQRYAREYCQPSFGIGTHFTNDFEGVKPMNIVIKLVAVKITESWTFYNDTCKLSEDDGKHTGKPEVIRRFMEALNMKG